MDAATRAAGREVMQTVWLDCDDETGRTYIEQGKDSAFGYLPVQATAEELAEWEQAIAEFDRVQAIMKKRWRAALHEAIAKAAVVNDGPFPSPGFPAATITRDDICSDDLERLESAVIHFGQTIGRYFTVYPPATRDAPPAPAAPPKVK